MDFWAEIRKLKGKTLKTLDHGNPFDVLDVTDSAVIVRPHNPMDERRIQRKDIESAIKELVARGEITRQTIHQKRPKRNSARIAAILAQLPNIEATSSPITLRIKR